MKKKYLIKAACLFSVAMLMGCAQEEDNSKTEKKGRVSFTTQENSSSTRRTTGIYSGSGINFYWTDEDRVWLIKPDGTHVRSEWSSIVSTTARATFYFDDYAYELNNDSYKLRYVGSGYDETASPDKVTIKDVQIQDKPNDAKHIGTDGDCGTATATYIGKNEFDERNYSFRLQHQASYLTFMPYSTSYSNMTLTEIIVEADKPIAGTYDFDDNGINTNNPTSPSKIITLKLKYFPIPDSPSPDKNAAIMVLTPGYYSLTVTYKFMNVDGGIETRSKTYFGLTLKVGKNKPVKYNLG
ncbi:hypothetical protein [Prevotella koreensis]